MDSVDDCYTYLDHKSRRDPGGIACAAAPLRALRPDSKQICATAAMIAARTHTLQEATSMPSRDVFSQNTNVLCLIACGWFRYLPGIRRPAFVKLSIRLQCRLPERRRVSVAAK